SWPPPFPLAQRDRLVGAAAGEGFPHTVRPENLDAVHPPRRPQAEVDPRVAAAQVARRRADEAGPRPPPRPDGDLGAAGVTLEGRVEGADDQPVAAARRDVAEQAGPAARRGQEQ